MKDSDNIWFIFRNEWLLVIEKREKMQLKFTYKVNKYPEGVMPMKHLKGVVPMEYLKV